VPDDSDSAQPQAVRETPILRKPTRAALRLERDRARGYSINAKQVVLAFVVEFWIIGLIVVGTYLLIAEAEKTSAEAIFSALLFPAALAMVELARVPLAIAVRTQDTLHVKALAAAGVIAAVTVTSFSLSQLAWKTFDNRIAEALRSGNRIKEVKEKKETLQEQLAQVQADVEQKINARGTIDLRLKGLQDQLSKIPTSAGTACRPTIGHDGKPLLDQDGKALQTCAPTTTYSKAQFDNLNNQISITRKELEAADAAIRQRQEDVKRFDNRSVEQELAAATAEYRSVVNKSQLHSYTAMVMGKEVADVTEADVKNLEKYLIIIPSIAAALASTLIAITAVRRIRPDKRNVPIPEEAMAYLFGPLVTAIHAEARAAAGAAVQGAMQPHGNARSRGSG
jgi:hypothetical protein